MQTIVVKNARAAPTGGVRLVKVDCCDRRRLAGAVFDLHRFDPEQGAYEPVREHLITDRRGALWTEGLPPGRYRLVETRPPAGYRITGSGRIEFALRVDPASGLVTRRRLVMGNRRACPPCRRCRRCCCCC